jgi:hypothetical protein
VLEVFLLLVLVAIVSPAVRLLLKLFDDLAELVLELVEQVVVVDASIHKHFYLDLLVLDLALLADLKLSLSAGC